MYNCMYIPGVWYRYWYGYRYLGVARTTIPPVPVRIGTYLARYIT
jgi:hypothetical protein